MRSGYGTSSSTRRERELFRAGCSEPMMSVVKPEQPHDLPWRPYGRAGVWSAASAETRSSRRGRAACNISLQLIHDRVSDVPVNLAQGGQDLAKDGIDPCPHQLGSSPVQPRTHWSCPCLCTRPGRSPPCPAGPTLSDSAGSSASGQMTFWPTVDEQAWLDGSEPRLPRQ